MNKIYSILFLLLTFSAVCVAEDKPPQVIADSWTMVPKEGHGMKLEEAIKAHMAYRKEKGDPMHWDTWVPVTGEDLNMYVVRSCCHPWAAQDSYRQWSLEHAREHFNETVHPHVKKYMHNFTEMDMENSHWGENTEANYVGVTAWDIKQGKGNQASSAIKQMSKLAKDNNWSRNWSWSYPVGGTHRVMLVTPFKNYAEMAPMEENFYQFAMKHMKKAKVEDMFAKFDDSFSGSDYTIWQHRKDLSMQRDEE